MIGATEVRVDFLDKLLNKDTGTIKFGVRQVQWSMALQCFYLVILKIHIMFTGKLKVY